MYVTYFALLVTPTYYLLLIDYTYLIKLRRQQMAASLQREEGEANFFWNSSVAAPLSSAAVAAGWQQLLQFPILLIFLEFQFQFLLCFVLNLIHIHSFIIEGPQ